jgi:preprotein translocase subunit SecG
MRKIELKYLRNELNQRLSFSYEHSHKLFGYIMVVWGGTLMLLGNAKKDDFIGFEQTLFIMSTIFFISVVVLYLLSQRNSENMREISKLAAYITVFYEEKPNKREQDIIWGECEKKPNGGKHDRIFWELATFKINKKEKGKSRWRKSNNEYFWLSCIATCIIVAVLFIMLDSFEKKAGGSFKKTVICSFEGKTVYSFEEKTVGSLWDKFYTWMFGGCFGYIVISVFLSVITFKQLSLNWEDWEKEKKAYLKSFLKYAQKTEHYTDESIRERFGEDFYKEVYG